MGRKVDVLAVAMEKPAKAIFIAVRNKVYSNMEKYFCCSCLGKSGLMYSSEENVDFVAVA